MELELKLIGKKEDVEALIESDAFQNLFKEKDVDYEVGESKPSYIYQLIYNGEVIDQTSLDERNENLAYSIMKESQRDGLDESLLSVSLLEERYDED